MPPATDADQEFVISRDFAAPRSLVFATWTEAPHLARWWGPSGFKMLSCKIDLTPGGLFHYGMQAANGYVMWGKWTIEEITPPERLVFRNAFSDENGGTARHPMAPTWPAEMRTTVTFEETAPGQTTVTLRGKPIDATPQEVATFLAGFDSMRMGFGATFAQLDAYLKAPA